MTMRSIDPLVRAHAQDLLDFIDAAPSPWHAVSEAESRLEGYGFIRLDETAAWLLEGGGRYYVVRGDSSVVVFVVGVRPLVETGFRIVGAHTDSPGLRLKPNAAHAADPYTRLGVEVYGGPILATFADRDLSLAGRVGVRLPSGGAGSRLVRFKKPLLRLPNLAIHMNREVNEAGLKFNKQTELPLILSAAREGLAPKEQFVSLLAAEVSCDPKEILSWELNVYDTQKGAFFGPEEEYLAGSRLDNLASCHGALCALRDGPLNGEATAVCAFFDHEEVGSESAKGADGSFLPDVIERIALATGAAGEEYKRALARSTLVSADMAHAYQPNFPNAYEPDHRVTVNGGPVIKINPNQRYTTESATQAYFMQLCEEAGVPCQQYAHRADLPCGSTIGPMTSARLGLRSVDVGNPLWAMHSIRESAGVLDHDYMTRVLGRFFVSP